VLAHDQLRAAKHLFGRAGVHVTHVDGSSGRAGAVTDPAMDEWSFGGSACTAEATLTAVMHTLRSRPREPCHSPGCLR
jgi:hypothetical protein